MIDRVLETLRKLSSWFCVCAIFLFFVYFSLLFCPLFFFFFLDQLLQSLVLLLVLHPPKTGCKVSLVVWRIKAGTYKTKTLEEGFEECCVMINKKELV